MFLNSCVPVTYNSADRSDRMAPDHKETAFGPSSPVVYGEDGAELSRLLVLICLETGVHWG